MAEHQQADLGQRLTRVEEACAFTQHDVEQLSGEVADLSRRLSETLRRMQVLERWIAEREEKGVDAPVERPPHSAGPAPESARKA